MNIYICLRIYTLICTHKKNIYNDSYTDIYIHTYMYIYKDTCIYMIEIIAQKQLACVISNKFNIYLYTFIGTYINSTYIYI